MPSFHSLRHVYISMMKNDMPEQMFKDHVGDNVNMDTCAAYGHVANPGMDRAKQIMDATFDRFPGGVDFDLPVELPPAARQGGPRPREHQAYGRHQGQGTPTPSSCQNRQTRQAVQKSEYIIQNYKSDVQKTELQNGCKNGCNKNSARSPFSIIGGSEGRVIHVFGKTRDFVR